VISRSESVSWGGAKASPTPLSSIVRRSGRSSSSQVSRKATATTAAAIRKTVEIESVKELT